MADPDRRLTGALRCALGLLAICCTSCRPGGDSLAEAEAALDRANRLDAQLEAANDPAAVESRRDAELADAREQFRQVLASQPDLPEGLLGLAAVSWRSDHDLPAAFELVDQVIAQLQPLKPDELTVQRPSGKTAGQLLARAYAERASYLLSRYLEPDPTGPPAAAPPTVPAGPLAQATADIDQALALDPQPDYQFLRDQVERLNQPARPMDAAGLGTQQAAP